MADPPPAADSNRATGDETGVEPDRESTPGTPRWVKVFGVIALVLVVLVVVMLVTGGGNHGPGRHTGGSGDRGGETTTAGVREPGGAGKHRPPPGRHSP